MLGQVESLYYVVKSFIETFSIESFNGGKLHKFIYGCTKACYSTTSGFLKAIKDHLLAFSFSKIFRHSFFILREGIMNRATYVVVSQSMVPWLSGGFKIEQLYIVNIFTKCLMLNLLSRHPFPQYPEIIFLMVVHSNACKLS